MRRTKRSKAGVILESLESRAMLAATTFSGGTLTIDFSAADETVTLTNNGTNITVISDAGTVTGDGGTFTMSNVTGLVVTDSGDFTNQRLSIQGSNAYSLTGGVDVSGAEIVSVIGNISTGAANLSIDANWNLSVRAQLSASDGNILLKGNEQATSTLQSIGVDVFGGSVTTSGTGTVTMIGQGGQGTTNINVGVRVDNNATVSGSSVDITGVGGATTFVAAYGVYVSGTSSQITSTGGAVVVDGTGGGLGSSTQNFGVYVTNGGTIASGGTGALTVRGTGGNAGGSGSVNSGVFVNTGGARIATTGGPLSITATGTNNSVGLNLAGSGQILSGGGALTLTADSMTLSGGISSGSGQTSLQTKSSGTLINLGGTDALSGTLRLGLTSTELNNILAGTLVVGNSTSGDITVSAATSLPSVSQLELITGGQIIDSNAAGNDITVVRLGMTAGTGIGVSNRLETAVSVLEATTATGGIVIGNTGNLNIGGVNNTLAGLRVTGASGGIDLINTAGDVRVTTSGDIVITPGNVSIQTLTSGNIITANNNGFFFSSFTGSVNSTGGSLTLNAAGDIDLGETAATNSNGDVKSLGNLTLTAGGNIFLDDQASAQTLDAGATLTITAGGDFSMRSTHSAGSLVGTLNGSGGLISISTGAGGTFTINGGTGNPGIFSGSGGVRIAADNMTLLDDIRSQGGGSTTLVTVTAARPIDLGTETTGALSLTNAEISQVAQGNALNIGDSQSGTITVSQAISYSSNLTLTTGANVTFNQSVTLGSGKNLTVDAVSTILFSSSNADLVAAGSGGISLTTQRNVNMAATGSSILAVNGNILISANQQPVASSGQFIGIDIFGGSVTTSGTGTVELRGRGGDTNSGQIGVRVDFGGFVSGASTIVTGNGGTSTGLSNWGVYVSGTPNASTITSSGGTVTINATGGGTGGSTVNTGLRVVNGGTLMAGGAGTLAITAVGGNGESSDAIVVAATSPLVGRITTTTGALTIDATVTDSSNTAVNVGGYGELSTGGDANLTITADSVVIDTANGVVDSGAGTTTFQTRTAGFGITLGGTPVPGAALGLTAAHLNRITAGNLVIGNAAGGNVSLTAPIAPSGTSQLELVSGGQIVDSNAIGSDITVARLGLTAASGVGAGNALDTAVGSLEATSATGGIAISNTGALSIGGVNSTLSGVQATTSGVIDLQSTSGNIRITTAGDIVKSSGNVSIKTLTSGNIITANNNGISSFNGSVNSTGGSVTLEAAGNLDIGETGDGNFRGDVRSQGNIVLIAGGSITVDDVATVQTPTSGSTISLTAGTDISILSTNSGGSLVGNSSSTAGLVSIRTGAGGRFTVNGNSSNPGILGGSGGVLVTADDMSLLDDIRAIGGQVNLVPVTAGREIDLGTDTTGTLGLTNAEINNVKVAVGLTIGASSSGTMTFSGAIAPLISTVSFITGGNVVSTTSSGNDITNSNFLQIVGSQIGTLANPLKIAASGLATNTSGSNGAQYIAEADSLLVTSLDLKAGTGTVTLTSGTILTGTNNDILGNVVVGTGATLGGSGIVTGNVSGAGTVAAGSSPGKLTINGDFTPTGTVAFEVNPPATIAGTNYDQIVVGGTVDLSGATLTFTGTTGAVAANQLLTPILNNGSNAIVPAAGFADGTTVTINGNNYRLFNNGGDGNDLVLVEASTPTTVYVDDSFTGNSGQVIADADLGTSGDQAAIFGINAFTSVASALAAVSTSGTVIVNAGTYAETVSMSGTQTLKIGGANSAQAVTVNSLATVSGSTLNLAGTSSLTFGDSTNVTMAGLITGSGSLVKQGSSIVTVSGDNDYSGDTTVSVGVLRVTANNGLGTTAAGTTVASGATLDLRNVTYSTAEAVSLQGGTLSNTNGTTSFSGIVTMTADSLVTTNSSTLVLAGAVQGAFRLNKSGAGTVRLSNTGNSFSNISIGGGTLQLGASGVIPDTVNIINSSVFDLNGFDEAIDSIMGNGSIGNSQVTTATLTLGANNNSGDSRLNGPITGAINLVKTGTGRQTLGAGSSSYTGTTTVNAGILAVTTENGGAATQALGAASGGTIVNAGGILEFQNVTYALAEPITVNGGTIRATAGGNNPTFGATSFGGIITLSTGTATFNTTTAATLTLNGIIDGDQALTKTGVGTLILANDNSYSGNTTVSAGKLFVNGSLASSSSVAVSSSGTLGGSGTINGTVTVSSGGIVSPGTSPGVLDTGNVSFASGSTYVVEVNGSSDGSFDQLNVTGTVSLGNATLSLSGSITSSVNQQIIIINNDGQDSVTGTFNGLDEGAIVAINGVPFRITYQGGTDNNDVVLTEVANFNVSLDSGNLTFTDLLGNISDSLTLSFDGTHYILTNSSQLLFTQIAGATGSGTGTVRVPATAVTGSSILLNGAGGADTLTVSYGSSNFADTVTLNGGAGNDILQTTGTATTATALTINGDADDDTINLNADLTFVAGSSMNVDLQDDTAVPGTDNISVGSNANMVLSGSGAVKLTASSIVFATGSSIATASGNVVVETASLTLDGSIATSGASLTLIADSLTISANGIIDGDANTVTIRPQSAGTAVNLGSDDASGILGLTLSELNRVTAGTLVIGGFTSGSVTISADISRTVNTSVQLMSGDSIIQNSAAGSFDTNGGTLLLTPDSSGSHKPNRSGIDVTASTVSYTPGSSVTIDIAGNAVDSEYTQLNVSGTVNLADVDLILTGSFIPAFGDAFVIVSATSVTGEFSNYADGSTFSLHGRTMRIDYTATNVTLKDATAQAPVLSISGNISYTENDGATAIASGVVVSDADNATLASATVTITNFVTGEDVLSFTNDGSTMGNIAVSTNIGGVLTLTSVLNTATKAQWQSALRSVKYSNLSENPTTTSRSVDFVISDGSLSSNTLTSSISITRVNDAPNLVTLSPTTASLPENSSTVSPTLIATITVSDEDSGTNVLSLSGTDAAFFEIVSNELRLKAGTVLNFEAKAAYNVTVEVNDATVGGAVDASQAFTLTVTDVNEAPTALSLQNTTTSLAENTSTVTAIKLADISVTDDALGTNDLSLTGTDAAFFEIVGSELRLKAGTVLNFEAKAIYNVTVEVNDATVGGAIDGSQSFTLTLTDVNEAPTVVTLTNTTTSLVENSSTVTAIKLADISVTDDALGTNVLSVGGSDAAFFEIVGNELRLVAGTILDFEAKSTYDITVDVNDSAVGGAVDAFQAFTLTLQNVLDTTSGADAFVLTFSTLDVTITHSVNGGIAMLVGKFLTSAPIVLDGLAANDSVRVVGTSGQDLIILSSAGIVVNGTTVTLNGPAARTLAGAGGNDTYRFDADEILGQYTLDESGGGVDTIDFSLTTTVDLVLNMATAGNQVVHATNLSLTLSSAVTFENVIGGSGADTLFGNSLNNTLTGGAGNDKLIGAGGDDLLIGGADNDTYVFVTASTPEADQVVENPNEGIDTLSFAFLTTDVVINLGSTSLQQLHTNRTLTLNSAVVFENILGGSGADTLFGNSLDNSISGGAGDDKLLGAAGNDLLIGGVDNDTYIFVPSSGPEFDQVTEKIGEGNDTLSFAYLTTDIVLNLGSSFVQPVHTDRTLKLNSAVVFENLVGGTGADTLFGNSLDNTISGGAGDDKLIGAAGNDVLIGGANNDTYIFVPSSGPEFDQVTEKIGEGNDTLSFAYLTTDIVLNLASSFVQPVHTDRTLKLNSALVFENVVGGTGADRLFGNSLDNTISGGAGDDKLIGAAGNDVLIGGANNDTYVFVPSSGLEADQVVENANEGIDTLLFAYLSTDVTLNLGSTSLQTVHTDRTLKLNSVSTFENAVGGTGNDTLLGNALANRLTGGEGNNILVGLEAGDILEAGSGRDILIGGLGLDILIGGAGDDILIAGLTTSDTSLTNLSTLRTAWISPDAYETRVASLRAGAGSPEVSLKSTINVLNDAGDDDNLVGGTETDWFFRALDDVIADLLTGEVFDVL